MFDLYSAFPIIVWKPVIEHDFGQERFLIDDPNKLFRQGRFHRVPVMTGITEYEFLYPAIGKFKMNSCIMCQLKFRCEPPFP